MDNSQEILQAMETFLNDQVERYTIILEMSRKQAECIKSNDTTGLMRTLSQKQEAIRKVEKISSDSSHILKSWEGVRENIAPSAKEGLEKKHEELKGILAEIMQLEESGREALSNKMGDTGKTITKMQKGKQMLKAYGANVPRKSNYKDSNG